MKGAIYVENSSNSKLGKMDAIYASIQSTCPSSCALRDKGCYAQNSFSGIVSRRLDKEAKKSTPLDVARSIARAIDDSHGGGAVPEGTIVRTFVSGDSRTWMGTRIIAKAISRWIKRGGKVAYGYSHAFARVPRHMWGETNVLASIDRIEDAKVARANGYSPAIVVANHISERVYNLPGSDIKWIPCPNQTRGITCASCKLCFNTNRLFEGGYGISFAAHGVKTREIKRRLTVIQ